MRECVIACVRAYVCARGICARAFVELRLGMRARGDVVPSLLMDVHRQNGEMFRHLIC